MTLDASLEPLSFSDGDPVRVLIRNATDYAEVTITAVIDGLDDVDTHWVASVPVPIDADGNGDYLWVAGFSLGRETSVYVTAVQTPTEVQHLGQVSMCICNPSTPVPTGEAVLARHQLILESQRARYVRPLGDAGAAGALEHRVVCAVERIFLTRSMRLPGVEVRPVEARPQGADQLGILNHVLSDLGWPTRVDSSQWAERVAPSRPWIVVVCPQVWAADMGEAARLAHEVRDELIAILSLNRGARGRPVSTIVEQRREDKSVSNRVYVEDAHYGGNLVGGFVAGEDQQGLIHQYEAIRADPLLKLCLDLYSEALAEPSSDARYLRLWSVLETLSLARTPVVKQVRLLNGSAWPGQHDTTDSAAPRVYSVISDMVTRRSIDEVSIANPAPDLYTAVRSWYGRRNATGHYGRLRKGDPQQTTQSWYKSALQTLPASNTPDTWLKGFERAVADVLHDELSRARDLT